jgi:hypothetical protein
MGKGPYKVSNPNQTPNAVTCFAGVRQWGISFIAERETTQTTSQGP